MADEFKKLEGDIATVRTDRSYPPGDRLEFTAFGETVQGKVVSLKKNEGGGYILSLKVNTLTKKARSTIEANC